MKLCFLWYVKKYLNILNSDEKLRILSPQVLDYTWQATVAILFKDKSNERLTPRGGLRENNAITHD